METIPEKPIVQEVLQPVQKPKHSRLFWSLALIGVFVLGIIATLILVLTYLQKNSSYTSIKVNQEPVLVIPTPTVTIQDSDSFFITHLNKPLEQIELMDLPNNSSIRSLVEYKDYFYTTGDGSIIKYSKNTGEVVGFSDLHKQNCDSDMALIRNYLYAACRIDNVRDAFGTTTITETPYFSEHFGILKINLDTNKLEKVISKSDGLLNQYNYELYPDENFIWIATFGGLGRIDTTNDKVNFFTKELGFPAINQKYGVDHVLVDKDYVWVSFNANAYSQGGLSLYDKKTQAWKAFGLKELKETQDRFDLGYTNDRNLIKTITGGIQIAFVDGELGMIEKKYDYNNNTWTKVTSPDISKMSYEERQKFLVKTYPLAENNSVSVSDSKSLMQLKALSIPTSIDGRANYDISPTFSNKRFVLTNGTIDLIDTNAPFRKTQVYLDSPLSISNSGFREALDTNQFYSFLVEPTANYALVMDLVCEGMGCENSYSVWLADLTNKKTTTVYTSDTSPFGEEVKIDNMQLIYSKNILKVANKENKEFFEINTLTKEFTMSAKPTPEK